MKIESIGLKPFPDRYGIILEYAYKDGDLYLHHDDGRIVRWPKVSAKTVRGLLAAKTPSAFMINSRFDKRPYRTVRAGFRFPTVSELLKPQEDARR